MSSRTSSRSTLTIVPSTMSPSLKHLIVLSMAARKSSLEPMSLTATWGEVTVGLGILLGCSGQVGVVGTVLVLPANGRELPVEVTRLRTRWPNWSLPRLTERRYELLPSPSLRTRLFSVSERSTVSVKWSVSRHGTAFLVRRGIPAAAVAHRDLQRHVKRVRTAHFFAYQRL